MSESDSRALQPFDLHVTFTGLCLFVPRSQDNSMHVLLPRTGIGYPGHFGAVEKHYPRVYYDSGYKDPGGTLNHKCEYEDLERWALEFPNITGTLSLSLPDEVVDVHQATNERIKSERLGPKPDEKVTSRITLSAGQYGDFERGALWEWGGERMHMSFMLQWVVVGLTSPLRWKLVDLNSDREEFLPELYPINGYIDLCVYHVQHSELPPNPDQPSEPPEGWEAKHFGAYYDLFDLPAHTPLPHFRRGLERDAGKPMLPSNCIASPSRGSFLRCMLASAH